MSLPRRSRTEVIEEDIDFSSCDDDELIDVLNERGYTVTKDGPGAFKRIDHLIVCGQIEAAKAEALAMVSELIGRQFK